MGFVKSLSLAWLFKSDQLDKELIAPHCKCYQSISDQILFICNFNKLHSKVWAHQTFVTLKSVAENHYKIQKFSLFKCCFNLQDEMCFGFMSYYPAAARFIECESIGEEDTCDLERSTAQTSTTQKNVKDNGGAGTTSCMYLMILMITSACALVLSRWSILSNFLITQIYRYIILNNNDATSRFISAVFVSRTSYKILFLTNLL